MNAVKQIAAFVFACCFALPAHARDDEHLLPEDSAFSLHEYQRGQPNYADYYTNVLSVLDEAFAPGVFARAIVLPSFQEEYAIAILRTQGDYEIIHLQPELQIWQFEVLEIYKNGRVRILGDDDGAQVLEEIRELEQLLPQSLEDVAVERCERPISADLGERVHSLWGEMLFRTRYPDRRPVRIDGDHTINFGVDGTTHHFSFDYQSQRLAGKTWSPMPDSVAGKFVAISDLLVEYCHSDEEKLLNTLSAKIDELDRKLSSAAY